VTKTDLQSDLLADLQGAANARPLPPPPTPVPAIAPGVLPRPTPALDVRFTPLRWSWPRVSGRTLRVGPMHVSVSLGS
jgi:hypothetical protein